MFRMEWRQDVDNWSLCVCDCAISFCSTRALWRGCQVTLGQPGKIYIKPSSIWALQKTRGQVGTHLRFSKYGVCICVYIWALSAQFPQALILNNASQRINKLTFWWPVVTALSNMSDPWSESRLCLFMMLLMSSKHVLYDVKGCGRVIGY